LPVSSLFFSFKLLARSSFFLRDSWSSVSNVRSSFSVCSIVVSSEVRLFLRLVISSELFSVLRLRFSMFRLIWLISFFIPLISSAFLKRFFLCDSSPSSKSTIPFSASAKTTFFSLIVFSSAENCSCIPIRPSSISFIESAAVSFSIVRFLLCFIRSLNLSLRLSQSLLSRAILPSSSVVSLSRA